MKRRRRVRTGSRRSPLLAAALVALLWPEVAAGLDPSRGVDHYGHAAWSTDDGLPHNIVQALAQTPDGYLWIGTNDGLARFDGVRFQVFTHANTPEIGNNYVSALLVDARGDLWIGTAGGGLTRLRRSPPEEGGLPGTSFEHFGPEDGLAHNVVSALYADAGGTLWIGTEGGGLSRYHEGVLAAVPLPVGDAAERINSLYRAPDATLWIGTQRDGVIAVARNGAARTFIEADGLPSSAVRSLFPDGEGGLWVGTHHDGLARIVDGRVAEVLTERDGLSDDQIRSLWRSKSGELWIGTRNGLNRFVEGRFENLTQVEEVAGDVSVLFEDRDGNLWVGTYDGLSLLRDGIFTHYTHRDGLPPGNAWSVYEDDGGVVYVATQNGLGRIAGGEPTSLGTPLGLPDIGLNSVIGDGDGGLWLGTEGRGVWRLRDGRFAPHPAAGDDTEVRVLYLSPAGELWIGTYGSGLFRLAPDGGATAYHGREVLPSDVVWSVTEDAAGRLWVGTDEGLCLFQDGRCRTYTTAEGLTNDIVLALYPDPDGTLWIGTQGGGLNRLGRQGGAFAAVTSREGLPSDTIFRILDDGMNHLWMTSSAGIFRVRKSSLAAVAEGEAAFVLAASFTEADGLKTRQTDGWCQPAGWKTRDGRFWFPTADGAATVTPKAFAEGEPPPVLFEELLAGGQPLAPAPRLEVEPGRRSLEIHYTATGFGAPRQIDFRYRLDPLDADWVDVGGRRTAFYTNVPPGEYTLSVRARGRSGTWGEASELRFEVEPRFTETGYFHALWVTAGALLVFALHRLRIAQLRSRERELHRHLSQMLAQYKILEGLLPICSFCKKIQSKSGSWAKLETYLQDNTQAELSHGVCPDCARQHYGHYLDTGGK